MYCIGDIFCIAYIVGDIFCVAYIVGDIFCVAYIVGDICVDAGQLGPRTGNAPRHHAYQSPFPILKKVFFYGNMDLLSMKTPKNVLASLEIKTHGKSIFF
jgi:hypothetical protein